MNYPNYVYDWNKNPGMATSAPLVPAPQSGFQDAAYGLTGAAPAAAPASFGANFMGNLAAPIPIIGGLGTMALGGFTPESIGAGLGSIGGAAAGGAAATSMGAAAGSIVPGIGTAIGAGIGALAGGGLGSLFGGESEEEKAKKEQKKNWIMDAFSRTSQQIQRSGQERKGIMDEVTKYFQQGNQARQKPII